MQSKSYSIDIGGKTMTAEFTDLAENASGSCLLRYGNTTVLATAVMSEKTRDDIDYFPLTVDYEERFYAAGAILGSRFMRREGRPSEEAILSGRIVDRTIRPLFPGHIRNEVQVIITVLSLDEDDPAQVAVNAASLALATSDIPWNGPVAAVRIGLISQGDAFVINPTYEQRDRASLDTLACGKDTTINMVEVAAKEADEKTIAAAFESAVAEHSKLLAWQEDIIAEVGKQKRPAPEPELSTALTELFKAEFAPRLGETVFCGEAGKKNIYALKKEWLEKAGALETQGSTSDQGSSRSNLKIADRYFEDKIDEEIHRGAIEEGKRADGRGMGEIRRLFAKAGGISPVLHGSGIFYRGGTHVFTALTLGGPGDSLLVDTMESQEEKRRFMHHYNFPPYSGGETGRMGGINRRAIGHGALAQKALEPVLPSQEQFPYTIRLVSECFASNGSTSMGSACASTLALMDGGVPIKAPVAGIAMGLMMRGANVYKILTDIQGPEDSHGDMDFKVAGTRGGVTAIQMDIKLGGVPVPILTEALEGARAARMQILDLMEKEIPAPRAKLSPRAPEIISMRVRPDQIGLVIGGGGKTINGIRDSAGVDDITIEDDGSVYITGKSGTAQKAREMIEQIVKEYMPGEVYEGEVTRLMDFGAFVKIGPSKDAEGLVHVSEVAPFRIGKISEAVSVGDKVRVMIKEIDEKGRINFSIKAADPEFAFRKGLKTSENNGGPNGRRQDRS
ncbi:polyribonucleotide nucleotidyltransferase [Candidatus Adlerbacteria bacterium RIFCSPHIGHO2_01_FULL_54_23]|uniref:Polyribonucleotide nucleotidyltransferase n=3 Tax=Candidatus Adleribacteriota TaxID=1752736 RepID=A0A1F4Y0L1_9BACT|nr:MAG: Polyribonucleotide nucleotidyltransferase [Candidatus Adlerbacteria bacterium GW2011_GWA1_54_10]KKW36238.1 MAG: Polyribonucleotide nucleotidyltransferase [Candidatus Adlerbacteria bacterium GW2011_GWA2_54_12]KKW37566.1 MAG: Polyribonucleotide nucleotidyltransferase [Candidatus Adlerbacteria bacterium GW2011_GWB1_54_7]OGC79410.1 MAG: polyribonucleotide nucleotidyltransferase [Candidatus Adlerbacteria bacterium RIFCSPHIGHO2_01_FULL_54_23]OGC87388.1 MAG: polyribonucleotide nucleotidyltrans